MTCDQPHGLGGFVGEILALRWAVWVLVLATASFLLFLSIVLLLWLADTLESRNIHHNRNACLEQPFAFLSIAQAFEPALAVLWEAPTHAMQLIQSAGTGGICVAALRPIFNKAAARFPEVYDGCGFERWVQFRKTFSSLSGRATASDSRSTVESF